MGSDDAGTETKQLSEEELRAEYTRLREEALSHIRELREENAQHLEELKKHDENLALAENIEAHLKAGKARFYCTPLSPRHQPRTLPPLVLLAS